MPLARAICNNVNGPDLNTFYKREPQIGCFEEHIQCPPLETRIISCLSTWDHGGNLESCYVPPPQKQKKGHIYPLMCGAMEDHRFNFGCWHVTYVQPYKELAGANLLYSASSSFQSLVRIVKDL
jgi:hypothetical protein